MKKDTQWLIVTYYCPTHGSENRLQPVELTKEDLSKAKSEFNKNKEF